MWSVQALVVHLLLLGSILSIYFQSTILSDLEPLSTVRDLGLEPPADRLVVFVVDGLRAESVLADNCSAVPDLRELFVNQGLVGISRVCPPTVTRPGHIAIFGGFNEDPTAALTNFGWNPSTFDTVFNRSRNAIGWTQDVVAKVFTHLPTGGAPLRFETFSRSDISGRLKLDEWVFGKVRSFLTKEENVRPLRNTTSVVFFIYLADIDLAGHAFMPYGSNFKEKLHFTQRGIRQTFDLFESVFNDSRTVYLMTADHGMNDEGQHGGGGEREVETPFILWGAGVNRKAPDPGQNFTVNNDGLTLPLYHLEQTQFAPLMSALIGLPPPMNNVALLPLGFLNASAEYELQVMHLNAMQLLAQASVLIKRHENGILYLLLPKFESLDSAEIDQYPQRVKYLVSQGYFEEALKISQKIAKVAQNCLEYYHSYYHGPLLVATTASYLVWFYLLLVQLTRESYHPRSERRGFLTWTTLLMALGGLILLELMILQRIPYLTAFYLLLPFGILTLALAERPLKRNWLLCRFPAVHLSKIVLPAGLLILMAFHNSHIGLLYLLMVCLNNRRAFLNPTKRLFFWLCLVILLSGILVVKQNSSLDFIPKVISVYVGKSHVVYFSMVLSVIRPLILRHRHDKRVWIINIAALLATAYGIYQWDSNQPVCTYVYAACWSYLAFAFLSIPYSGAEELKGRLELIMFNMLTVHLMLTISMASLFVQIMVTEFVLGLELYEENNISWDVKDQRMDQDSDEEDYELEELQNERPMSPLKHLRLSYRYAALILLYFYVSFFGTGHWFFNFTFKPITTRLFFPQFSLHLIAAFILLKIFIPSIIVMSSIYALISFGRKNTRSIFICLFLMNDTMSLYFCYFVNNRGSWQEVRESLDHLLVTHVFIILLLVSSWISKGFLYNTKDDKPPTSADVLGIANATSLVEDSRV
uniref:GPI ethanolamine phosphate transferase 1 n=1 Tax=Drosophila rhopaloa TaxID=1041015 RepID=A0A6P4ED78_DRORH